MNSFVERLGWMLLHSLWQFTLVAFLVGVLVRLARNRSSALRYGILAVSLFASILFPIATWGLLPASESVDGTAPHQASSFESKQATEAPPILVPAMNVKGSEIANGAVPADLILPQLPRRPDVELETSEIASQRLESTSHVLYEVHGSWFGQISNVLRPWLAWIVLGWCLGVAICSLRPLFGWYTLWRLQRFGVSPVPEDILAIFRHISDRIGLRQTVRVMYSTLAQVPVVVGYLRPVILLPVSLMSSIPAAQLEAILAHELAHVRRHDFIVNLLQTIVETVFFYHPAVWWLSHQIRVERKHCCDDRVVSLLGNRVEYGRALLALEQLRGQTLLLAQGAADGSLVSRIRRIVLAPSGNSYRSAWWGPCCSVSLLVTVGYATAASLYSEASQPVSPYQVTLLDGPTAEVVGATEDGADPAPPGRAAVKPEVAVVKNPAVTTAEIEKWLQEFDSSDSSRQTQAAVQIEKRYTQHPPGTVDVLLVRGLTKYLDCQQFAASGQYTRQVGDWCKQALIQIGAPAVPELLVLATNGDQNARRRVGECLGAIKVIGPPGVATLITLLDDAESEVQNSAVRALKLVSNEPTLIPQLIKTFEQGSLKARSSAVGVLGLFQEDRVEAVLLRALDDPDAQVRAWAAYAVLETPHPKLAPELVRRLKTVDNSTLSTLEGALRLSASKIVPDLLRGLQDESPRARAACVRVLFHVLPDHATLVVPALSPLLQDPDPQVRRSLFQVLCIRAYLFDPALLSEPLLKGLDDPNADVRSSAAEALRAFAEKWPNDRRAIDRLLQQLDDPDPAVVAQVIRALAEFREPRAVPQLIRLAAQEGNVGAAAATALGKLGGQNVIDVLRKNLGGKQPEAIAALGELHDFQSIPTFIELLKDSNEFVRTAAAKALAQNPDPRAIMPLIEGLKAGLLSEDGPHFVRRYNNSNIHFDRINSTLAIIDALGRSGDSRAIQALIQRIDNADSVFFDEYDFSADDSEEVKFPMESSPRRLDAQLSQHPFAWALFHAGRPAIPELAIGLSSKSRYTRRLCAWVLDNLSVQGGLTSADFEGIRPALLKALDDADPVARYCAVKSVGHLKLRLAEATLLKLLESPLPFDLEAQAAFPPAKLARAKQSAIQIQVEVIRALSGIRTVASRTALLHALDNPAPEVRSAAAGHLGEFPASHTVDPLIKALADPGACAEAARVLGHIGDPRAIPPLIQLLQTSLDPVVKENAAQSLGLLGADSARPALRDVLVQIPQAHARSEGFAIQLAAAISLCQLQDAVGTARIKELLGSSDYETRNQVASKLGLATYFSGWRLPAKLSHEPTRDVLREFAEHAPDTSTRLQLVEALGGQLDEKTRTFLERRANDPHEKISWSIWRVLVRPNPAAYEVQLLKLLDKPEPRVQIEVAGFLGQLSSERVTERLLQLSFDKDVDVRVAAVMALGLHRTPKVDARLEELSHIDPSPKVRGLATMILQSAPKVGQTNKPRAEESELAAREILKGRFGLDLPDPKTEHSPRELILFNIAPAAWEHIGELSDIPAIHVMGGDVRGAPLRQIARIRGLKSLRIVNAKCLPADLESLAGHPSLESLSAMLSVFDELHSSEAARARFVSQLTTSEQAWIKDENSKWLKLHPESNREHILQAAVATDRALVSLAGVSNLKSLELINTYSTRRGFEALQRLPVLESLSVDLVEGSWHIEPRPLTFPKLRKLATSLSNPQLIADIAGSPNLEDLALSGMKDSGVAELIKIPGLKRLKFWANQLSDAGLAGLAELPQLEQINLHQSHGQLTYAGVEKFRMLKPKCAISGDKKLLEPETNNK